MSGTVRRLHRTRAPRVAAAASHQSSLMTSAGLVVGLLALWALLVSI